MPPPVSACIVTYRTPTAVLERALASLGAAVERARSASLLGGFALHVVDNSPAGDRRLASSALAAWPASAGDVRLHAGHGNPGYGAANNLVLPLLRSELHLVMNPDVELAYDSLEQALRLMQANPDIGLLAPDVRGGDGEREYLCKRYPSLWVLFLRGFAPEALRRRHRAAIDAYEMRDAIGGSLLRGVPLASGCFMLVRTSLFSKLGGFDPRFFMYFEDYDLSLRLGRESVVAYAPQVRISHGGGAAARKGWRHVAWFITSAWRFFSRHGWKLR